MKILIGLILIGATLLVSSCATVRKQKEVLPEIDTREHPLPQPDADMITPRPVYDDEKLINYTVQHGDTLFSISRKTGMTVQELQSVNNLTSTNIKVGQTLLVRGAVMEPVSRETIIHNLPVE